VSFEAGELMMKMAEAAEQPEGKKLYMELIMKMVEQLELEGKKLYKAQMMKMAEHWEPEGKTPYMELLIKQMEWMLQQALFAITT
jgi:hypothetical protein